MSELDDAVPHRQSWLLEAIVNSFRADQVLVSILKPDSDTKASAVIYPSDDRESKYPAELVVDAYRTGGSLHRDYESAQYLVQANAVVEADWMSDNTYGTHDILDVAHEVMLHYLPSGVQLLGVIGGGTPMEARTTGQWTQARRWRVERGIVK